MLLAVQDELARAMVESSPWWWRQRRTGGLSNSAATQAQNEDFELAQPNINPIYNLPAHVTGHVLQTQGCKKTSMTQGNNRMPKRNPTEGPVSMMQKKPEASSQTVQ